MIFLDTPREMGKTFVIKLLLAGIRQQSNITAAVASLRITAAFLYNGRTAHSALRLPLDLIHCETPLCNFSKGTG